MAVVFPRRKLGRYLQEQTALQYDNTEGVLNGEGIFDQNLVLGGDEGRTHPSPVEKENTARRAFDDFINKSRSGGCRITSNDTEGENPRLLFCNTTSFMCETENEQVTTYEILFDYDVYYNPESNLLDEILPYVEEVTFDRISSEMGLNDCKAGEDNVGEGVRRKRRQVRHLALRGANDDDEGSQRFVGLSLLPRDRPDDAIKSCSKPVVNEDDPNILPSSDICIPVKGALTVYTTLTDPEMAVYGEVSAFRVLEEIRRGMENDMFIAPGHISKVRKYTHN